MINAIKNAKKYKYIWIWKFLVHWMGTYQKYIDIGFYPDYENVSWSVVIKFNRYNVAFYNRKDN